MISLQAESRAPAAAQPRTLVRSEVIIACIIGCHSYVRKSRQHGLDILYYEDPGTTYVLYR